jgi:hypothetical protein
VPPDDEVALLRRAFDRVAADRDSDMDAYAARWNASVQAIETFVRDKQIMTLPDPLTLALERRPSSCRPECRRRLCLGPVSPEAKDDRFLRRRQQAARKKRSAISFFRAFNHHFTTMIVPHELIPGITCS